MADEQFPSRWVADLPLWMRQILDQHIPRWRSMNPEQFNGAVTAMGACLLALQYSRGTNTDYLVDDEPD